ncbi:putative nuclease HARBI1 isoform X1 [Ornithodoros turicata]|uniref:putative nuclease HARBI1 isoform X1 n=2 Tax=Ornithodoros turicata TaxID=34597 RepID=UPI0031398A95
MLGLRSCVNNRGSPLPPVYQLLLALRFYRTGSFQMVIGDVVNVSQPTVSRAIATLSRALARLRPDHVRLPTPDEIPDVRLQFYKIAGFPGVTGCIDGTHIPIQSPGGENAELFRNRKGVFSVNVQVVSGPNLEFYDIVASWAGSTHDSRILQNSRFGTLLENSQYPGIILGDSGYACKPHLLTPLLNVQTASEERYNKAHIKTRNSIERAFGVWKRMFPCLTKKLATKLETTVAIITATAVLYNICRKRNLLTMPDETEEVDSEAVENATDDRLGVAARRAFIQRHFRS